jgi:predicted nucleic acid-binding protein
LIVLDTSGLFAALNDVQPGHGQARQVLEAATGPLILSPFTLAELDYLITTRVGVTAATALLHEVEAGSYELAPFDAADVGAAREIVEQYRDLAIGFADASVVVLAGRYGTEQVLTFDERHFRVLRAPSGKPFRVLPADA